LNHKINLDSFYNVSSYFQQNTVCTALTNPSSLHPQKQSLLTVSLSRQLLVSVGNTAELVTSQRVVDKQVVTVGLEGADIKDATSHALEDFSYRYSCTG
jgi:hypothetical protein